MHDLDERLIFDTILFYKLVNHCRHFFSQFSNSTDLSDNDVCTRHLSFEFILSQRYTFL